MRFKLFWIEIIRIKKMISTIRFKILIIILKLFEVLFFIKQKIFILFDKEL